MASDASRRRQNAKQFFYGPVDAQPARGQEPVDGLVRLARPLELGDVTAPSSSGLAILDDHVVTPAVVRADPDGQRSCARKLSAIR